MVLIYLGFSLRRRRLVAIRRKRQEPADYDLIFSNYSFRGVERYLLFLLPLNLRAFYLCLSPEGSATGVKFHIYLSARFLARLRNFSYDYDRCERTFCGYSFFFSPLKFVLSNEMYCSFLFLVDFPRGSVFHVVMQYGWKPKNCVTLLIFWLDCDVVIQKQNFTSNR